MRVVSWNMQHGKQIQFTEALKLFEKWEADAVLIQEPSSKMKELGHSGDVEKPRGCNFEWRARTFDGGTQGTIVILTRDTFKTNALSDLGPFDLGQGTKRIVPENPLVSAVISDGTETLKLATCHAPFDASIRTTYIARALECLENNEHDLFMGDFNTYGVAVKSSKYKMLLSLPTSNKGNGHPLDKIIGLTRYDDIERGRIVPKRKKIKKVEKENHVSDIEEPSWESKDVPSDHLPIYFGKPSKKLKR